MASKSLWQETDLPHFPPLSESAQFDVVIIGGGITGLTAAYLLKRSGKKVCLLERDQLADVDTGHTTAHLTYVTDLRLPELVKNFGQEAAGLTWEAGRAAINTIEQIASREKIECEFRRVPGFLHAAISGSPDEADELRDDARLANELGFEASFLAAVPYFEKPGVRFADQAKFHPRAYLAALAQVIHGDGSAIFENTEASDVSDDPLSVAAGEHTIRCDHVVIATHVPLVGKTPMASATLLQTKIYPYTSYVIGAQLPKGLLPEASFWDTSDPYFYLRIDRKPEFDYAIFGGMDHKTGQEVDTEKRFGDLTAELVKILPAAKPDRRWSGQVIETNDGLPFIGETAERQFAATGFSGNGMTFGTFAAMMACDAVWGRKNSWQELFNMDRKKMRGGALDYLKENVDYPYYYVKDRLSSPEGTSTRSVKRGEGKILKLDGQRAACYRDEEGNISKVSAVCTHMGCLVRWNGAEKTWDCPCHGSRFYPTGQVLAGPAESPLEPIGKPAKAAKS